MSRMQASIAGTITGLLSPGGARARLAVFGYHQVLETVDPFRTGEPDAKQFAQDIDTIASVFNVLALPEAARFMVEGRLPSRAACITFDDGYVNNLTVAAPILARKGVPATFFIATDAVDRGIMWNDLLIEATAHSGSILDTSAISGLNVPAEGHKDRLALLQRIIGHMKYLPLNERLERARAFYSDNMPNEPVRLMMSRSEVAELAESGFDVGGHTINHPILSELEDDTARAEIIGCRAWLEKVTGRRPKTFAYPNGIPGRDFDERHEQMVADAGFDVAVSTRWAVGSRADGLYRLPRIGPWWRQGTSLAVGAARGYLRSYF